MQTTATRPKDFNQPENKLISAEELFWMPESKSKRELVYGKLVEVTPVGYILEES